MESLWDDLCRKAEAVVSPSWHEDVLKQRDAMKQRGEENFEDWKAAKRNIKNQI